MNQANHPLYAHAALDAAGSPLDKRKKAVCEEGAVYRARIVSAKQELSNALTAEALTKSALSHAAHVAYTGLARMVASKGLNLRSLMPVVIGGVSFLGRRALLAPILKGGLAVAAAAVVARFLIRRKNKKTARAY